MFTEQKYIQTKVNSWNHIPSYTCIFRLQNLGAGTVSATGKVSDLFVGKTNAHCNRHSCRRSNCGGKKQHNGNGVWGGNTKNRAALPPLSLYARARMSRRQQSFLFCASLARACFLFLFLVAVFLNRYFSLFLKISIKVLCM